MAVVVCDREGGWLVQAERGAYARKMAENTHREWWVTGEVSAAPHLLRQLVVFK